jgi:hypothetical protein
MVKKYRCLACGATVPYGEHCKNGDIVDGFINEPKHKAVAAEKGRLYEEIPEKEEEPQHGTTTTD